MPAAALGPGLHLLVQTLRERSRLGFKEKKAPRHQLVITGREVISGQSLCS